MKKAISPLIAWILLIGFSVAMAAFISNWVIEQTKETFQPEKMLEDMSCDGVSFSLTSICQRQSGTCNKQGSEYTGMSLGSIQIINKGAFTIKDVKIIPLYDDTIDYTALNIKPGATGAISNINICIKTTQGAKNELKIIPVIEKEEELFYCTKNAVILNHEALFGLDLC